MGLRRSVILRGLWKPKLRMGVEPFVWLVIGMTTSIMAYAAPDWYARIYAGALALILFIVARLLNRKEPQFFAILFRYIKYQSHYLSDAKWPGSKYKHYNKD